MKYIFNDSKYLLAFDKAEETRMQIMYIWVTIIRKAEGSEGYVSVFEWKFFDIKKKVQNEKNSTIKSSEQY